MTVILVQAFTMFSFWAHSFMHLSHSISIGKHDQGWQNFIVMRAQQQSEWNDVKAGTLGGTGCLLHDG